MTPPRTAAQSHWWPVAPSILIYLILVFVPVGMIYYLDRSTQIPSLLVFFVTALGLAGLLTILEFVWGRGGRRNIINHADIASAFFGFFLTSTIGNGLVIVLLAPWSEQIAQRLNTSFWPSSWPLAVQVLMGLVLSDLAMYPIHRYMHRHDSLWRVHVVHHSVSDLRPMRNFLQHPFEVLLLGVVPAIPLVVLGAPAIVAVLIGGVRVTVGIVDHSSLPLRTGWLDYVIHTPNDHWWHHNLEDQGGANFTTVVIEIDEIFRSFKKPPTLDPIPPGIGIATPQIAQNSYLRQLSVPFRWRSVKRLGRA